METIPKKEEKVDRPKFAIIGLGFISGKHLDAIEDVNGELIAGCDIDESKIVKLPHGCRFFKYWKKMIDDPLFDKVDYVSICTPNYLHYAMIKACRDRGKEIICEKPLVLHSEQLSELDDNVYSVLQLRYSPLLESMKSNVGGSNLVNMNITVQRGDWYFDSWKNNYEKSGGLAMNIGIHYFDILINLFNHLELKELFVGVPDKEIGGVFVSESDFITWKLSLLGKKDNQHRSLVINNIKYDLSRRFDNLHTKVYEDILQNGGGITPRMIYKSHRLVESINLRMKLDNLVCGV